MVSIEVSKTYSTVTEESASRGDFSDTGYCFSPMLLRLKACLNEIEYLGSYELQDNGNSLDIYGTYEEQDPYTDEATTYHIRVSAKPRTIKRILKLLKAQRRIPNV